MFRAAAHRSTANAERDGFPSNPEQIFLSQGASEAVKAVLDLLISHESVGVRGAPLASPAAFPWLTCRALQILIPIPQYPLYSASLALFGAHATPYYLDENQGWSLSVESMAKSVQEARAKGIDVRALVVINPGNPTGQTLSRENMEEVRGAARCVSSG